MTASGKYDFTAIEAKWQQRWEQQGTFVTPNPGQPGFDATRPKFYCLDFFPYPSGAGLHVGHPEGYTATDVLARWKRMQGFNVLHPMGWDAFGLPAEQYAVETNTHPRITTTKNIATFKRQLKSLGFSYDWSREFATTDADYFRWTQWIFLQLFNSYYDETANAARPIRELVKKLESEKLVVRMDGRVSPPGPTGMQQYWGIPIGMRFWHELTPAERGAVLDQYRLAYVDDAPVNWCPALGTVLSNEEVTSEGRSERGNHPVFRRPLKQWMLRITAFADRLLSDLEPLDWPEPVKLMQRNWIGRSEGAEVQFEIDSEPGRPRPRHDGEGEPITVFTTRPDTLFGATYMVLSPEHPLVDLDDEENIVAESWPDGTPSSWRGEQPRAEARGFPSPRDAVRAYQQAASRKSERDRTADSKKKTGVFTGRYAINPVNGQRIPTFVADYVLMGYGTGAIMAVPGHDTRDLEFAETFGLPVLQVVQPPQGVDWRGYVEDGVAVNSPASEQKAECSINALPTPDAKRKITDWLESKNLGRRRVQYKLRDWLFSRQRYWGEPFPVVHGDDGCVYAVADSELPVTLPEVSDFRPQALPEDSIAEPQPPLGRAKDWVDVRFWLDEDGRAHVHSEPPAEVRGGVQTLSYASNRNLLSGRRETNTMPNWAGSCWYYLRFCDPKNAAAFCGKAAEKYWMVSLKRDGTRHVGGIDLYLGGTEHAVLHLLYARFWHKALFDLGHVSTPEPFGKLFNQGMIRAFAYRDSRGVPHGYDEIEFRDEVAYLKETGEKLAANVEKMSKTLKNVINPDDVTRDWGADALRLYELFMGPLEASKPWNPRDVPGVFRFLQRAWRLVVDPETGGLNAKIDVEFPVRKSEIGNRQSPGRRDDPVERALHKTIKKVTEDLGRMSYNTAIAAMMEFTNVATAAERLHADQLERFVLLLSPFAPHIAEELWERLSASRAVPGPGRHTLAYEPWPTHDESLTIEDELEIPVQINGKVKARLMIARDADQAAMESAARADAAVAAALAGKTIRKVIVVPGRMVNIVAG